MCLHHVYNLNAICRTVCHLAILVTSPASYFHSYKTKLLYLGMGRNILIQKLEAKLSNRSVEITVKIWPKLQEQFGSNNACSGYCAYERGRFLLAGRLALFLEEWDVPLKQTPWTIQAFCQQVNRILLLYNVSVTFRKMKSLRLVLISFLSLFLRI